MRGRFEDWHPAPPCSRVYPDYQDAENPGPMLRTEAEQRAYWERTHPRYRLHNMHGPTVHAYNDSGKASTEALRKSGDEHHPGMYYGVVDETTGETLIAYMNGKLYEAPPRTEPERRIAGAIEDAIDFHVRAFSDGLAAHLIGLTIIGARGDVWDGDGHWSIELEFNDGSSLDVPGHCFAHGPLAEIVRMAGGFPDGNPEDHDLTDPWKYGGFNE